MGSPKADAHGHRQWVINVKKVPAAHYSAKTDAARQIELPAGTDPYPSFTFSRGWALIAKIKVSLSDFHDRGRDVKGLARPTAPPAAH